MVLNPYNQEHQIRPGTGVVHCQVYNKFISAEIHPVKAGQHAPNAHPTQDYKLTAGSISQSKCQGVVADESKLPKQQTEEAVWDQSDCQMLMEDRCHDLQARATGEDDESDCFLRVFSSQDVAEESGRLQIDDIIDIQSFVDDEDVVSDSPTLQDPPQFIQFIN